MDHQEFIDDCLREHNRYRVLHGVHPLRHSINLDKSAQEWSDDLITKDHLQNSPIASKGDVGENISSRSSSSSKITLSGTEIATQWYSDIKSYDFSKSSGVAGSFTQLIWKSTEEVGFGIAHDKGKCVVVAHYRPAGNIKGQYATNVLPKLDSGDVAPALREDCHKEGNVQCPTVDSLTERWTEKLDLYRTPSSHQRTDSMSSDEHFEIELQTQSDYCKAQKRQLRQFIRETIATINHYRVLHGVPILKHNKEIDKVAQSWSDEMSTKSALSNSNSKYNGDRLGENMASRWSSGECDYGGKEVVDHWYSTLKNFSFGKEPQNVQGIGNVTQLLWKSTTEIGVGKTLCSKAGNNRVIVVCHFHPAGNVLGRFTDNVLPASK